MTSTDNGLMDFRSRAVAASEAMLRNLASGSPPDKCGISYCLVRQPSLSRLRAPLKVTAVVCLLLGVSGVAMGAGICFLMKYGMLRSPALLAIAICCSVGGILTMLVPTFAERWTLRHYLPQCDQVFGLLPEPEGMHIDVEHAPTCDSLKILAEDIGLLYIYRLARYVKIDGLSYEYLIQSKDIVGLSLRPNGKSVFLSFSVGEERLDLVLSPRSLWAELKRQTTGSSRSFFVQLRDALQPTESPRFPTVAEQPPTS